MTCNVNKVGSSEMRKSFCAFSTVVENYNCKYYFWIFINVF